MEGSGFKAECLTIAGRPDISSIISVFRSVSLKLKFMPLGVFALIGDLGPSKICIPLAMLAD